MKMWGTDTEWQRLGNVAKDTGMVLRGLDTILHIRRLQGDSTGLIATLHPIPACLGCPCWFDMTRTDCACCNDDAVQCGAPMQNYCYKVIF